MTPLIIVGNVVAVVALLPLFAATNAWSSPDVEEAYFAESPDQAGISMSERQLSNIYAYGPDGERLKGVQLFDQDGNPFELPRETIFDVCPDGSCDELKPRATRLETGETAWNVYPRTFDPMTYNEMGDLVPGGPGDEQLQEPPFVKVPRVEQPEKVE